MIEEGEPVTAKVVETAESYSMKYWRLADEKENMKALLWSYLCDPQRQTGTKSIELLLLVHRILNGG